MGWEGQESRADTSDRGGVWEVSSFAFFVFIYNCSHIHFNCHITTIKYSTLPL